MKKIDEVSVNDYKILVLPGGVKAMEKVRQEKKIINFISEFNKTQKIIACICSAAQLLISAKVVKGRKIAGYYSMKDDLINAGGNFVDAESVVSDNLVSCPHYKWMGQWMAKVIEVHQESDKSWGAHPNAV